MNRYRVEEATVQQPVIVQVDATDAEALSWAKAMEVALAIIDLQMGYLAARGAGSGACYRQTI